MNVKDQSSPEVIQKDSNVPAASDVKKQKPVLPIVLLVVGVILFLFLCCGCSLLLFFAARRQEGISEIMREQTRENQGPSSNVVPTGVINKVNKTASGDSMTVTVLSTQDSVVTADQFLQPREGMKHFAVEVSVTYNGNDSVYVSSSSFTLRDSKDYAFDASFVEIKAPQFKAVTLKKGGTAKGWLTYEIPKNSEGAKVIFAPVWTGTSLTIDLTQ